MCVYVYVIIYIYIYIYTYAYVCISAGAAVPPFPVPCISLADIIFPRGCSDDRFCVRVAVTTLESQACATQTPKFFFTSRDHLSKHRVPVEEGCSTASTAARTF